MMLVRLSHTHILYIYIFIDICISIYVLKLVYRWRSLLLLSLLVSVHFVYQLICQFVGWLAGWLGSSLVVVVGVGSVLFAVSHPHRVILFAVVFVVVFLLHLARCLNMSALQIGLPKFQYIVLYYLLVVLVVSRRVSQSEEWTAGHGI